MESSFLQIKNLLLTELETYLQGLELPGYRAGQIFNWIYQKKVLKWEEMRNLPMEMRRLMTNLGMALGALTVDSQVTADDGTTKFLFELADGKRVESVFIPETERNTVCFSTQVGCGMGCAFCATGKTGLTRNLTTAEIVDQIVRVEALTGKKLSNLVAMGQGEPLANYEALLKAIRIINHPQGLGIGARRITISTCGIVPAIFKLAAEPFQVNLAISLHAADDLLRNRLLPINQKYPLNKLLEASRFYIKATGRRITYEYTLIDGVNDRPADCDNLIKLLAGMLCHINLIPFNKIPGTRFFRSKPEVIKEFAAALNRAGIETTIRKERGSLLTAACGQLRNTRPESATPSEKR
jgi:23S rRNA (adenine2503-C2)-methyltransferase